MLSVLKKLFVEPVGYKQFSGEERILEREEMYELYKKSSKEIWIVAGELDPEFYNNRFVDIISEKLEEFPDFRVNLLFSKDANVNHKEKIKIIYNDNRELCELLNVEAFNGRFSMFLSETRPDNHFGIADNNILIEKIHKPKDPRDVLLVYNYKDLVEKYKRYFIKLIRNSISTVTPLSSDSFKDIAA